MLNYSFKKWKTLKCCRHRVPLKRMRSIRSQLRANSLLQDFLKDHRPDMFNRRYAQCFPADTPSLRLGRSSEKIYNFMDVRTTTDCLVLKKAATNMLLSKAPNFFSRTCRSQLTKLIWTCRWWFWTCCSGQSSQDDDRTLHLITRYFYFCDRIFQIIHTNYK